MRIWQSLRARLVFSYIVLTFLLLSFVGYVFSNAMSLYAVSVQNAQKNQYAQQAAIMLKDANARNLSPAETLALLRENLPGIDIEPVVTPSLNNLMGPGPGLFEDETLLQTKMLFLSISKPPGDGSFILQSVTENNGSPSISFYRFAWPTSAFALLSHLYVQILEVLGLALVLSGVIGWLLSRWIGKPLAQLASATETVAAGNFLELVNRPGIFELDRVVEQFNKMVLQLRISFRSLAAERDTAQRFAADAAHELKTPVATLRAYQDVITEHPERLEQALPALGRQVERMEQIISGLLQMATLDKGDTLALEVADLCAFIKRLEPIYEALAAECGHRLTTVCPEAPVQVMLNQRLLELALDNLMDNACKYTPPSGMVSLTLQVDENEALIIVQDSGKGIPPDESPYIFDRFRRGIDTQSIPGTGLGLAIVQESLKRMGGTVSLESQIGLGAKFLIRLPLNR
ncbi:HAMP domain-containing histidine kinase [Desulfosporosinus fructosivorans]|uniref:histidine kinase n=1 Tax=Desulfosporosinus fructosivorans TaxID=2018669 RepID=A0A4Z0QYE6_9FIRM|nr:HAMP domain-containing sensor histidine kinase [Desulfosporosinus fructosivorans]TGE35538.1 HAMP domain-containing histidine kinase [Desulfosporosinus fructosivorans]